MVMRLEEVFPNLAGSGYRVTSPRNGDYNCIAWAAGDTHRWWWPGQDAAKEHWPLGVPRQRTRDAFIAAFASLGYTICEDDDLEAGYEKIALFADVEDRPTHAARQLPNGHWSSKLGKAEDIEHRLRDLDGKFYGSVVIVMKRLAASVERSET